MTEPTEFSLKRFEINAKDIPITQWDTPKYKVIKAYNDGVKHAKNHFYGEEPDPFWASNIKSWAINPYTENRPAVFYSWLAGFCEEWSTLNRADQPD